MIPVEYIYGDWYFWIGAEEAQRKTQNYLLSLKENTVLSGSRVEGFCIPQLFLSKTEGKLPTENFHQAIKWEPDRDMMTIQSHCFVAEDGGNRLPIFIAEHLEDDPRYVKLHITRNFQREFPHYSDIQYLNHAYLFPDGRHPFLEKSKSNLGSMNMQQVKWSFESHGPVRKLESTGINAYEEDQTRVFTYPDAWPAPAMEWLVREKWERPHGWPSSDLIQEIVTHGCHIAPVGRGKRVREPMDMIEYARNAKSEAPLPSNQSGMDELEWRVSFSVAENKLAASVTPVQRHVMILLKMLKKLYFEDPISTYHLKQIFFWECERRGKSFWKEENLANCLLTLLDKLAECLKEGQLRHYIMRESNLLQGVDEGLLNKAHSNVIDVRMNFMQRTITMLQRLQSLTYLTSIYLKNVEISGLIGCLQDKNLSVDGQESLKSDICKIFEQKCKDVIASILADLNPETEELLLVPLNAYKSILARIICKLYTFASGNIPFEEFVTKHIGSLALADDVSMLSVEYHRNILEGSDSASSVPNCKAMCEVLELRKKATSAIHKDITTSSELFNALELLKKSDFESVEKEVTKELKGQINTTTYEDIERKVLEKLNLILKKRSPEEESGMDKKD